MTYYKQISFLKFVQDISFLSLYEMKTGRLSLCKIYLLFISLENDIKNWKMFLQIPLSIENSLAREISLLIYRGTDTEF